MMRTLASWRPSFGLRLLPNKFPALHGLRVLGILAVIQVHFSTRIAVGGLQSKTSTLHELSRRLWFSMDLFFFMSGFLIGSILLAQAAADEQDPERDRPLGYLLFYARRSFRIIPAYYVVLTILACTQTLSLRQLEQLPLEYLYLTNYADLPNTVMLWGWSLCVEEHFYLAVPFLIALILWIPRHGARIALLVALWLSGIAARALVLKHAGPLDPLQAFQKVYIPTHARYDILVAGILFAYLLMTEGKRLTALFARPAVRLASLALTGGLLTLLLTPAVLDLPLELSLGTITGILFFNLCAYLVTTDGWAARALGHRACVPLATLGYGVYLVHYPIVNRLAVPVYGWLYFHFVPVPLAFGLGVLAMFGASLPVAYLLHQLVEKPSLAARDWLVPND